MSKGGHKPPAPKDPNPPGSAGNFTSGFDPYPMQGFNLSPAQNSWQGGQFVMPGISGGQPVMNTNVLAQFPGLASILAGISPQGAGDYSPQFAGGISQPRVPMVDPALQDSVRRKRDRRGNNSDNA